VSDLASLYRRWIEELWVADEPALDGLAAELFASDLVVHQAGMDYPSGPAAASALVRMGRGPFRDVELLIEVGPLVAGDFVSARWTFSGAYVGGIPGVSAPEGTPVRFGGIDIMRAEDGKFAEYWTSSDGLDLMRQLGA
jgi:predicted ester cyclase